MEYIQLWPLAHSILLTALEVGTVISLLISEGCGSASWTDLLESTQL